MSLLMTILLTVVPPPGGIGETVLVTPAAATVGATRTGNSVQETPTLPPPPPAPVGPPAFDDSYSGSTCTGAIPLLNYYSPGWDSYRMARIMFRESRCNPGVTSSTGCCRGLLQIHQLHVPKLGGCGVYSRTDLFDPIKNVCSAAKVFVAAGGYSPWAT